MPCNFDMTREVQVQVALVALEGLDNYSKSRVNAIHAVQTSFLK